jgi:hypothetical protein
VAKATAVETSTPGTKHYRSMPSVTVADEVACIRLTQILACDAQAGQARAGAFAGRLPHDLVHHLVADAHHTGQPDDHLHAATSEL